MHESRDNKDIEHRVRQIHESLSQGEGSEGIQALERYEKASNNFLYWLELLHDGKGNSSDYVQEQLEEAKQDILNNMRDVADDEDHLARIRAAIFMIIDMDRRAQLMVGPDNVRFADVDNKSAYNMIAQEIQEDFNYVAEYIDSEDDMEEFTAGAIEEYTEEWLDRVVDTVYEASTPNFEDMKVLARKEKISQVKRFARDAGAVALGSLPIVGVMFYLDHKNNR